MAKIICPYFGCRSTDVVPITTQNKFSVGKALVGNTVGGLLFGPVGAIVGAGTGINGKKGKTTFYCQKCNRTFEMKV